MKVTVPQSYHDPRLTTIAIESSHLNPQATKHEHIEFQAMKPSLEARTAILRCMRYHESKDGHLGELEDLGIVTTYWALPQRNWE
jgi:hypothetical protein